MVIEINYNCGCCGASGDCDFCETVPTGVNITIGGGFGEKVKDFDPPVCEDCDDYNNTYLLSPVPGESCAFYLSFEDAGLTCYDPSGSPAGFYAEITADEAWHIEVLNGIGQTIASWNDAPIIDSGCCEEWSNTPFGEATLGIAGRQKLDTFAAQMLGARTFGVDITAEVDAPCDWSKAVVSIEPLCDA